MDAGVHLPLIDFSGGGFSYRRLAETVDAARACGFGAVSANDHFLFSAPWLDGPTALAAVIERSGGMKLMTTVALAALRGPVPLAKALSALDELSDGRVIAGVGPGSSQGRLQRGRRAVRAAVAALRRDAPADQGHAPAGDCGQRRQRRRRPRARSCRPGQAAGSRCGTGGSGLAGWYAPRCPGRRRLACLGIQHHPGGFYGGHGGPGR